MSDSLPAAQQPLSVLIPERGTPDLLAGTLGALAMARAGMPVSSDVRVLVNGAPAADYAVLRQEYPLVQWQFERKALGFHGAIARLLSQALHPWVYLLNSDMRLHPDALRELLRWRAIDVFAIASQIEWPYPERRREETGYTVPVLGADGLELHDLIAPDDSVRGHVYASGGAALFQTAALRRFFPLSAAYAPFYFEDADWSLQAWASGFRVLYCPASRAEHLHRGTIGRVIAPALVQRVVRRNLDHLRWRYADAFGALRWTLDWPGRLGALLRACSTEHRLARRNLRESPVAHALPWLHQQRYPHPMLWRHNRQRVLLVSPFNVLPPAHGGARRIVELVRATSEQIDWVLLHDEASTTQLAQPAQAEDALFRVIHSIGGRPPHGTDCQSRWAAHAHPVLRCELKRLVDLYRPDAVCVEFLECIELVESWRGPPLVWTLHDAGRELPPAERQRVQQALENVDKLVVSTAQDLQFWTHPAPLLVRNGVRVLERATGPSPSPPDGTLLLLAPLRYQPNLLGLLQFLDQAWPLLRAEFPALQLQVAGGVGATEYWGTLPLPAGVELLDGAYEPTQLYAGACLAINPQTDIEGSAIKVGECLANGRVMVSTVSGARGYEALECAALIRVSNVQSMAASIAALLRDPQARWSAERSGPMSIAPWSWDLCAQPLLHWLQQLRGATP